MEGQNRTRVPGQIYSNKSAVDAGSECTEGTVPVINVGELVLIRGPMLRKEG